MAKKSLIVVESPTKVKTIAKFLGPDYVIKASAGHVKDLPGKELGVDVEKDFAPKYITIRGKGKILAEIKKAAVSAEKIYLAPDPDREGEAICWHLAQELSKEKAKICRLFFNEITKTAVVEALKHPTHINDDLVNAQQARRILDRLVGYKLSPLLWRKVQRGLSAGRVQSVAVRLVCEREEEILAFRPEEYWSVTALLEGNKPPLFEAKLFKIKEKKADLSNEEQTQNVLNQLDGANYRVLDIRTKPQQRKPVPPFITSKLQQEAARKLGFSAKKTMLVAQQLYEGIDLGEGQVGLITYMRTDSTRLAKEAQDEAREFIGKTYGREYVPEKPNFYASKKGAQDAHEAIRPSSVYRTPDALKSILSKDHFRLYELIWQRMVASQMPPAVLDVTQVDIEAGSCLFRANGSVLRFPGFMALYIEGLDDEKENEENKKLPPLAPGELLKLHKLTPAQHFTQAPPRYTEATLVKALEEKGIGRPSTYANIMATIQARKYVDQEKKRFHPTPLGMMVNKLLVANFPQVLDIAFTAQMEEELDKIEEGQVNWVSTLREFYQPFISTLEKAESTIDVRREVKETDLVCEKCRAKMVIRWGRRGQFLACSNYPECKNSMNFTTDEQGKVTAQKAKVTDHKCPKCGNPLIEKTGRFGTFLACSSYPDCKHIQSIPTGVPCPQPGCAGTIVEKKSKKGKVFYGCDQYPKCSFALWDKPLPKPCPQCGATYLLERNKRGKGLHLACVRENCGFEEIL
ncbi:MAG: type I DNA topoisomerase [Candidatus Schekmanbacteria bacterium]|nr:type I DNA topoisomerase [Candidatus Schekmanbacteria bacterium]